MKSKLLVLGLLAVAMISGNEPYSQAPNPQPLLFYCSVARPPVFKSWEPVRLTYCLKYLARAKDGREVKIVTDFAKVSFGKFEVDPDPQIRREKNGEEVNLHITYILRRLDHNKGQDTIPPLIVQYAVQKPGEGSADQYTAKSDPVFVEYVTTVTEKNPDIRSAVDFGNFKNRSRFFFGSAILIFLLASAALFREFFFRRAPKTAPLENEEETIESEVDSRKRLSPHFARQVLLGSTATWFYKINASGQSLNFEESMKLESDLHAVIRDVILAEIPRLGWGKTPEYIRKFILDKMKDGRRRQILLGFAYMLLVFQDDIERSRPDFVFGEEGKPNSLEEQRRILSSLDKNCRELEWANWIDFKRKFDSIIQSLKTELNKIFGRGR